MRSKNFIPKYLKLLLLDFFIYLYVTISTSKQNNNTSKLMPEFGEQAETQVSSSRESQNQNHLSKLLSSIPKD